MSERRISYWRQKGQTWCGNEIENDWVPYLAVAVTEYLGSFKDRGKSTGKRP